MMRLCIVSGTVMSNKICDILECRGAGFKKVVSGNPSTCSSIKTCVHRVWLMKRVAEKLGFMKVLAIEICAKVGIGRKVWRK